MGNEIISFKVSPKEEIKIQVDAGFKGDITLESLEGNGGYILTQREDKSITSIAQSEIDAGKVNGLTGDISSIEINNNTLAVKSAVKSYVDEQVLEKSAPVGSVVIWMSDSIPTGWKECNGASLSKSEYPQLNAVLANRYGSSGNNFNLPDMRAMFPRGLNNGRGDLWKDNDWEGREVGSLQSSAYKSHYHYRNTTHVTEYILGTESPPNFYGYREWVGKSSGPRIGYSNVTENSGGSVNETRPNNIAVMFIMKVQ